MNSHNPPADHSAGSVVDYDIHGVVGVRLVDPTAGDIKAVAGQLGPANGPLEREPDIVIRFQERLPLPRLTYLGLDAGHTDEGYYILASGKAPARARVPFEAIGGRCEIVCSVPLLIAIINMTFLGKDYLPLHASAFLYDGVASVLTGWAKGGKTESMLAFANHGAAYIADEWTIFSARGERMFGIAEPIRLWQWHFEHVPGIHDHISWRKKVLFGGINTVDRLHGGLSRVPLLCRSFPVKLLGEALPAFRRQLNARFLPAVLFDNRLHPSATPDRVFLVMSHDRPDTVVEPCDSGEIADRMLSSNHYEQMPFIGHYHAFTFAFPDRRNEFLDSLHERQRDLLQRVFRDVEAYRVLHPYPVDFEELYETMRPYCEAKAGAGRAPGA
jgi:hypothetical protein